MVNEQIKTAARACQVSAGTEQQEARRQVRLPRACAWIVAAGAVAIASGVIPMNDVTILLAMVLGCAALLRTLYR